MFESPSYLLAQQTILKALVLFKEPDHGTPSPYWTRRLVGTRRSCRNRNWSIPRGLGEPTSLGDYTTNEDWTL